MKTNKRLVSVIALVLAIVMLSACAGTTTPPANNETTPPANNEQNQPQVTEATEEKHDPVVLEMIIHSNAGTDAALEEINKKFNEKYPWITVNLTSVEAGQYGELRTSRLAAGNVDILETSFFAQEHPAYTVGKKASTYTQLVMDGYIMDLTGQDFINNWDPAAVEQSMTSNGKVVAVPSGRTAYNGIFYSKAIFAQYNLTEPKTWDEFIQICETLKNNGIAPMTAGAMDTWPTQMLWDSFVNTFEGDVDAYLEGLWTGTRKFTDEGSLEMFEKAASLVPYFEENVINVDYNSAISRFVAGKAAMMPDGTWSAASIDAADPSFEYGYFALPGNAAPANGGDVQLAGKYDVTYSGAAETKHPEEVLLWLEFYSQPEIYTIYANAAALMPAMDIECTNEFINSLASKTTDFQAHFQNLYRGPSGAGQYCGFKIGFLKSMGGDVADAKALAELAQKDWDDAYAAVLAAEG